MNGSSIRFRPPIEASTLIGKKLSLSKQGGWFGLLNSMNVLSQPEAESFALGSEFFHDLEYGAYQKSYKLITLRAMLKLSSLREQIAVEEIARVSREEIFADPRLTADLSDAQASFVDVWNPTAEEWLAYWMKNPVAAWTRQQFQRLFHTPPLLRPQEQTSARLQFPPCQHFLV
jgi:hypothetical protein